MRIDVFGRFGLLLATLLLTASCATTRPDLGRLYAREMANPAQPPVILIHGLMGSTLVKRDSGEEVFPRSISNIAFSDYAELRFDDRLAPAEQPYVPGKLLTDIGGVDFYGELLAVLRDVAGFQRGTPGTPVGPQRRRHYVFLYDWRDDNVRAAQQLHAFIERIRADYGDPDLKVDIIAHSNGGLITNYYLRYGDRDVLQDAQPMPNGIGASRVRRVVLLGTPNLGAITSVQRLDLGFRLGVRLIPIETMTSFITPYQTLPSPLDRPIVDVDGKTVDVDLYDPAVWRTHGWGVYDPEQVERIGKDAESTEQAERSIARMRADFERHLVRAERFQNALSQPLQGGVEMAAFGGDCEPTARRAVLQDIDGRRRLAYEPDEVKHKRKDVDYEALILEPGDGLVPRISQDPHEFGFLPMRQTFFLCERHEFLIRNPYFQNNLLYFLLRR